MSSDPSSDDDDFFVDESKPPKRPVPGKQKRGKENAPPQRLDTPQDLSPDVSAINIEKYLGKETKQPKSQAEPPLPPSLPSSDLPFQVVSPEGLSTFTDFSGGASLEDVEAPPQRRSDASETDIDVLNDITDGMEAIEELIDDAIVADVEQSGIYGVSADIAELERDIVKANQSAKLKPTTAKPRPGVSTILLSVAKAGSFSRTTAYHFQQAKWRVEVAQGVDESIRVASPERISLIITDTTIKGFCELCLALKVNRSTNHIPIIALSPPEAPPLLQQELRVVPDVEMKEPFGMKDLLQRSDWELARMKKSGLILDQRVPMVLPSRLERLEQAKQVMDRLLRQSGLTPQGQLELAAAFAEALGNAAKHGNRNRPVLFIEILYLLDREKITLAIKDEGEGFDIRPFAPQNGIADKVNVLKERLKEQNVGSLGIPLLSQCCDRVQFNAKGNMVTLTKFLAKKVPQRGSGE